MNRLDRIRYKFRYNSLPRLAVNALKRLGVTILPYYLFRRDLSATRRAVNGSGCELIELQPDDMPHIAALPLVHSSEQTFRRRLAQGQRCFGLRQGGVLVGFSWFDTRDCSFRNDPYPLASGEIYAYDIFTLPAQRGRQLAPLMNALVSRRLEDEGYTAVISVVDSLNRPSLRVARKIGAVPQRLNFYVGLFGRWEWNWKLRDLRGSSASKLALRR